MAKCKGCGAEIEWVKTSNNRSMPVNPEYIEVDPSGIPHDVIVTDDGQVVRGCQVHDDRTLFQTAGKVRGRVPHWGTCPKQGQFRG